MGAEGGVECRVRLLKIQQSVRGKTMSQEPESNSDSRCHRRHNHSNIMQLVTLP